MPLDIKILIIDDSAFARTLLKLQLQLLDLNNVIEADSASEGWAILKSKNTHPYLVKNNESFFKYKPP